jgi:hypothetical protein
MTEKLASAKIIVKIFFNLFFGHLAIAGVHLFENISNTYAMFCATETSFTCPPPAGGLSEA